MTISPFSSHTRTRFFRAAARSLPFGENATAEILTFVRSKGLYAGATLDGTVIRPATERNAAYYGVEVSPTDVLVRRSVQNPHADGLRNDLAQASRPAASGS